MQSSSEEFELRFGWPQDFNSNLNWEFSPLIKKTTFENIKNTLALNYPVVETRDTVLVFNNGTRSIDGEGQKKEKISQRDLLLKSPKLSEVFVIRISHSNEIPVAVDPNAIVINTRVRHRFSFKTDKGKYDLTVVNNTDYSIEYEIFDKKNLEFCMKELIKLIFGTDEYSDHTYVLTQGYGKTLISTFEKHYEMTKHFLVETRPRNVNKNDIPEIRKGRYSFTNKLDGVGYKLFITKLNSYLINSNSIKIIKGSEYYNETLIDVEVTETQVYAFDCLVFKGKNVCNDDHLNRINNITDRFCKELNILKKKFFYSKSPLENFKDVLSYMYTTYGDDVGKYNDGIINTPFGTYDFISKTGYKGRRPVSYYDKTFKILKLKFSEAISIDFKLNLIENNVFGLYLLGQKDLLKFSPFVLDGVHYYPPTVFISNSVKSGDIVELIYDKKYKKFTMLRKRLDKTNPNYYTVGENTFADTINGFTFLDYKNSLTSDLENLFNKYIRQNNKVLDLNPAESKLNYNAKFIWYVQNPQFQKTNSRVPISLEKRDADVVVSLGSPLNLEIIDSSLNTSSGFLICNKQEGELKGFKPIETKGDYSIYKKIPLEFLPPCIAEHYTDEYYRCGVDGDGSCFFHSFLFCISTKKYIEGTQAQRKKMVSVLRIKLANSVSLEDYLELDDQVNYIETLEKTVPEKLKFEDAYTNGKNGSYQDIDDCVRTTLKNVYTENSIKDLLDKTKEICRQRFSEKLENCRVWADYTMIKFLSKKLECNIHSCSSSDKKIIKISSGDNNPYVVILNLRDSHFEPLIKIQKSGERFVLETIFVE